MCQISWSCALPHRGKTSYSSVSVIHFCDNFSLLRTICTAVILLSHFGFVVVINFVIVFIWSHNESCLKFEHSISCCSTKFLCINQKFLSYVSLCTEEWAQSTFRTHMQTDTLFSYKLNTKCIIHVCDLYLSKYTTSFQFKILKCA